MLKKTASAIVFSFTEKLKLKEPVPLCIQQFLLLTHLSVSLLILLKKRTKQMNQKVMVLLMQPISDWDVTHFWIPAHQQKMSDQRGYARRCVSKLQQTYLFVPERMIILGFLF